jgi:phosphonate transport system substrate-binding protein
MHRVLLTAAAILSLSWIPAAFAAEKATLTIGVIPEMNLVRQMERFGPLADYLGKKTGMDIVIKPLSSYEQLYENIRTEKIDGGFFGSFIYAITRSNTGIIPLARPVTPAGKSTYSGLLLVRKDAGITKPADMKGKTIALVSPATTAGYLVQKEYFANNGIDMDKDLRILWKGSHEAVIKAVLIQDAEIGGAKNTIVSKFRKGNKAFDAVIDIVSPGFKNEVPDNTLAVNKNIGKAQRELLTKALVAMHTDPEGKKVLARFGAVKFIPTSDQDFRPLYDMLIHQKVDLKNYPYKRDTP